MAVASTSSVDVLAAYLPLVVLLALVLETRLATVAARMAPGAPFLLLASATFLVSAGWRPALLVALRGGILLALAAILTAATDSTTLVRSISRLGVPPAVGVVAVLMARYVELLDEEWIRMSRARRSRCPMPPRGLIRFHLRGGQVGALLLRSWERAERIHLAMLARGFNGALPDGPAARLRLQDWTFVLASVTVFATVRWL